MSKKHYFLWLFSSFCISGFAQQTKDTIPEVLNEVVVTDSRFPLKRENSGKTVIKISAKELAQNAGRSVAQIINTKSGIEVNGSRGNAGQNISTFVRGGNNRQVLVIIDGIQVSDPSNPSAEYDLRLLDASQVESIEIIKGAASSLYGNAAATAVINIITKKAVKNGVDLTINSVLGTNQSQNDSGYSLADFHNSINLLAKTGKWNFAALASQRYTDGLSAVVGQERDPFSAIYGNFKLGYQFSKKFKIIGFADYNKYKADFDNAGTLQDAAFSSKSEQSRFGISSTFDYKNGSVELNAAFSQTDRDFKSNFPSVFNSERWVVDVFNKYKFNGKWHTIVGLNLIQDKALFASEESITNTDPYANVVYVSGFGLNINAGARLNNHSKYGAHLVYSANPSYNFKLKKNDGYLKIFASYATSFIAPNLSQLFGPFGANPELEPEENTTIEGGIAFVPSEKLRLSALYFNRLEENFIAFTTEYQNTTEDFTARGAEFEFSYTLIEKLSLSANYTFTEYDRTMLRLPKHKVNSRIGYDISKKTFAAVDFQYTSSRFDRDFSSFPATDLILDGFSLVNLYGSHQFSKRLKAFAGLDNLLNETYTEIFGYTTKGRNVRLGFTLNF